MTIQFFSFGDFEPFGKYMISGMARYLLTTSPSYFTLQPRATKLH